jgi:hypothetical protein
MLPELQILRDIKDAFLTAFGIVLRVHFGDEIAVAEAKNALSGTTHFDYWLVPDENDKQEDLAQSTEGHIQTFTADLLIFGRKPDAVVEELYRILALIYKTANLITGISDAPQKYGDVWFHRFDPRDDRITMRAELYDGIWCVRQRLTISASKDV